MAHRIYEGCRDQPSDQVLNILEQTGRPARWNIDQIHFSEQYVYPQTNATITESLYTIRPPRLEDRRVIDVYYDMHPNELEQSRIGRSLEDERIPSVSAYPMNYIAKPGKRQHRYNMNLVFPGDTNRRDEPEIRLASSLLKRARMHNPDVAFELHNTPLKDDAMLFMRRRVGPYVGRVAGYLSELYGLPIVEPAPTMLASNFGRAIVAEMPYDDPRFSIEAWRSFLEKLANNNITLPDKPATPHYSYHSEITTESWVAAGQTTEPRPAFSPLPQEAIDKLGLPAGSHAANWVGGTYKYIGMVVAPFTEFSDPRHHDSRRLVLMSNGISQVDEPRVGQCMPAK